MLTNHVTSALEAYLDHKLPPEEHRIVEAHLSICPTCTQQFQAARRLADELKPTFIAALGRPVPPPVLRQHLHSKLNFSSTPPRPFFSWAIPGRVLNTVGTLAVIALLAFGVWTVIQGQLLGANVIPEIGSLSAANEVDSELPPTTNLTPLLLPSPTPQPIVAKSSEGDSLQPITKPASPNSSESTLESTHVPMANPAEEVVNLPEPEPTPTLEVPTGTIAFAYFNQAPERQVYETHFINADGSNHRLFPLDGVSEPALHAATRQLAYRAYSEPTSPRSLLSGDLEGKNSLRVGGFWEDAQPDWSPTEDRLIYASKREVDRRWRLYTSRGDGTEEKNLRREGESPTFAPDGLHFAFVSCDNTANHCGLWVGDLDTSEYESKPILEDPLIKSPDWSPTSAEIAYMANPQGNWDLFIVNSDGTNVRQLTNDPAIEGLPAWSPDGQWLAFLSNREGNWGIWLLHLASGETRRIFSFDGGVFTPPTSPPYDYKRDWYDEQISWGE